MATEEKVNSDLILSVVTWTWIKNKTWTMFKLNLINDIRNKLIIKNIKRKTFRLRKIIFITKGIRRNQWLKIIRNLIIKKSIKEINRLSLLRNTKYWKIIDWNGIIWKRCLWCRIIKWKT